MDRKIKTTKDYCELLRACHNIVLTGAPGTGKTYLARQIAAQMVLGKKVDDLETLEDDEKDILKERTAFVQFHPSYDYTDFVEGLRPDSKTDGGNEIVFERRDGIFKEFCVMALKNCPLIKSMDGNINVDDAFKDLCDNICKGDIKKLTSKKGSEWPVSLDKEKKIILVEGDRVTLKSIKKSFYDLNIQTIDSLNSIDKSQRGWSGKQGDETHMWAVLNYLLKSIDAFDSIESAFTDLWKKIDEGDISTLTQQDGTESSKVYIKKEIKETIYFLQRADGDGVDLEKVKNALKLSEKKDLSTGLWAVVNALKPKLNNIKETTSSIIAPYIFIIDEINRGELSKIFGELFFSIDPGYRGKKEMRVQTQYQNLITDDTDPFKDGFYVPNNVYIIGTMNDIDRSIESMDFAIRRRFAWVEVKANDNTEMLSKLGDREAKAKQVMMALNNAIWDENNHKGIEGLSRAYHIGASYFLKLDKDAENHSFEDLWNLHLEGLLREYLRGLDDAEEKLNTLRKAYNEAAGING